MSETTIDGVTQYYDEVRVYMDCPEYEQNRLLSDVNQLVLELQADGLDVDYDDLVEFFGEAEELAVILMSLAVILMSKVNPAKIRQYHLKKKLLNARKYLVAVVITVGILLSLGYTTYSKENNVYTVNKSITITDIDK